MADGPPPPPPPPHGENPKTTGGGLPPGNYDIFVVPPHSSGSGFLYLPSLQPQRNSFIAGFACAIFCYLVWVTAVPVLGQWLSMIAASGGAGVLLLVAGVGVIAWAFGKTQAEGKDRDGSNRPSQNAGGHGGASTPNAGGHGHTSHSSTNARSPPPQTPQQDYASPPRQEYSAPPPRPDYFTSPPPPPRQPAPEYAAPPPRAPPPQYTATPPSPPPQPRPPKPTPTPQAKSAAPPPPKPTSPTPTPTPTPSCPPPPPQSSTKTAPDAWEKAKEETRRREEARKRAEELKKKEEEVKRKKEEANRQARALADKRKWEQAKAREKEAREREAREGSANDQTGKDKEKKEREQREREARERIAKERREKVAAAAEAARSPSKPTTPASTKYERPNAKSYASTETSSAYDARTVISSSTASSYTETLSSYAPSTSTARTSPPPEYRGPYNTSDPDKIIIKAVYMYTNDTPKKPVSQLVSGQANVSNGLVLRLTTEGFIIDDDVRNVPQREWDVKAWTLKSIEKGKLHPYQILRATVRDGEGKRYLFVIPTDQEWKLDVGLARLRKGNLVRSMGMSGIKAPEMRGLLTDLNWI